MADDKKTLSPDKAPIQDGPAVPKDKAPEQGGPAVPKDKAPVQDGPAAPKDKAPVQDGLADPKDKAPEGKNRAGNVIDISGAMIDKIVSEKVKQTGQQEQGQPPAAPKDKAPVQGGPAVPKDKAPAKGGPAAPKDKAPEKPDAPTKAPDSPELKEKKDKLEQELRKKYGIPKSDKAIPPYIIPEEEKVVRLPHDQLHTFKDHPFNVEKNAKYMAFVASIRALGVTQPAIVRPREAGGYEIISGHRRDTGSIDAEIPYTPCIIRPLNDDQAIQQRVEDNVNNREITTMELARALKMQLESIKHQGARQALEEKDYTADIDKRSNAVVAERNGMSVKQVQRHIALTRLVKPLQEMVDGKAVGDNKVKIAFTPAVELSYITPKNQQYIAVAIEGQVSAPSLSQAQRMRELDQKGLLNHDIIDGIMLEEKKEVDKVIISSQELGQYFGKDKTPREMKDQILKLLDEWKAKQPPELGKPEKKVEKEK